MTVAETARKVWRTCEPFHGFVYFAPTAVERYAAVGLEGRSGYFASRSAPMGAVADEVVIATFFNFEPGLVRRAMDGVWDRTTPAAVVAARFAVVDDTMRTALGDACDGGAMVEAAQLLAVAADACDCVARPLAAGHAAVPRPEEPHLAAWRDLAVVREFRGDGHLLALADAGLSGCEALVTHAASGDVPRAALQSTRAWSDAQWDAALGRLVDRGLCTADGGFTDAGREQRAAVEATTDRLAAAPFAALGSDGCDRLRELVRPWSKALLSVFTVG